MTTLILAILLIPTTLWAKDCDPSSNLPPSTVLKNVESTMKNRIIYTHAPNEIISLKFGQLNWNEKQRSWSTYIFLKINDIYNTEYSGQLDINENCKPTEEVYQVLRSIIVE